MVEKIKILIIDDSNLIRYKVKSIFEDYNVEILELNNADDLFRFSKKYQTVNLIILDINLPNMDGIQALQMFNKDSAWLHIPVIMLTCKADRITVQKALQAGAIGYIRKPFTEEEVLERVQKILGVLPLAGDNKNIWSINEIEKHINLEVERAKLGDYSLSVIEIDPSKIINDYRDINELMKLKDNASNELHSIDIAIISPNYQLILILPFTNLEDASTVVDKIYNYYIQDENAKTSTTILTFPYNCKTADEILEKLITT